MRTKTSATMKGIMAPPKLLSKFFFIGSGKRFALSIFTLMLFSSNQVAAMSMIGFKVCLASESSGVVTMDGTPVEGATVKRYVKSSNNEKEFTHETATDKDGRFSFSTLHMRSLLPLLLIIQPVTHQEVTVTHDGKEYLLWSLTKMNWDENSEVNSHQDLKNGNTKPLKVSCELSDPEKGNLIDSNSQGFYGRCMIENVAFENQ